MWMKRDDAGVVRELVESRPVRRGPGWPPSRDSRPASPRASARSGPGRRDSAACRRPQTGCRRAGPRRSRRCVPGSCHSGPPARWAGWRRGPCAGR
ncbi:hypothetical protein ACFFX0_01830 [Citricoccus parietis]|uniref:Uncharacterized protein n=1 Tax=Citricoccus parietis TaxID=592307 RepID=A0ABV5FTK4_9MICC